MKRIFRKHKRLVIILLLFISIGFAYLSTQLDILGNTLLKANTWDVHFENVQVSDGSVTSTDPVIDANRTSVTFSASLDKPGDFYEFTVDAVNGGTIDAMISTITDFNLTESQNKYLETSVTYEDGEEIKAKQQLLFGDTAVYKIKVSYKKDLSAEDLPEEVEEATFTYTVTYVQRDNTAIRRRAENTLYNVLKTEAESGGLAKKYTGAHQDSMDASKSTKDIYHWYADNDTDGTAITDKNNVLFAEKCWKLMRTTDTGGVKLLYNGLSPDSKCLDTRTISYDSSKFSDNASILTIGYKYNPNDYIYNTISKSNLSIYKSDSYMFGFADYRYFSDSISWDSSSNKYSLINSSSMNTTFDRANRVNMYTFGSDNSSTTSNTVKYITGYGSDNDQLAFLYYIELSNGQLLNDVVDVYTYGDSFVNNGDGTYTINSPSTFTTLDYFSIRSNLNGKFVCKNVTNNTCSLLMYVSGAYPTSFFYYDVNNNYKFANSFSYENNKYTLSDNSITSLDFFDNNISNYHYTCWNDSGECSKISYIYKYYNGALRYIELSNGKNIENVLDEMLYSNELLTADSNIKTIVETWYENNLSDYGEFLDDVIFCNDRSQSNFSNNGWNPNGGIISQEISFGNDNLYCTNVSDRYSVSNNLAHIKYKVGLITYPEMLLLNNNNARKLFGSSNTSSWTMSPQKEEFMHIISGNGGLNSYLNTKSTAYVRPAIGLKNNLYYSSGNGSKENPYIIDTN